MSSGVEQICYRGNCAFRRAEGGVFERWGLEGRPKPWVNIMGMPTSGGAASEDLSLHVGGERVDCLEREPDGESRVFGCRGEPGSWLVMVHGSAPKVAETEPEGVRLAEALLERGTGNVPAGCTAQPNVQPGVRTVPVELDGQYYMLAFMSGTLRIHRIDENACNLDPEGTLTLTSGTAASVMNRLSRRFPENELLSR